MEAWVASNIVAALLVAATVAVGLAVRRDRLWSEAARTLWTRRYLSILVVGFYLGVGLLDSI